MARTRFSFPIVEVVRVIDGDTLEAVVDLGFKLTCRVTVRLAGVDAPELHGDSRVAADKVKTLVQKWIVDRSLNNMTPGAPLILESRELDKYGRVLGDVMTAVGVTKHDDPTRASMASDFLTSFLLSNKLAKPYAGEKKQPWTEDELATVTRF